MTVLNWDNSVGYMHNSSNQQQVEGSGHWLTDLNMSIGETIGEESSKSMARRPGKRPGRKPVRIDEHAKLERSRQSARECRARKKLRYQYLEELVLNREKAIFVLRKELETFKQWCFQIERGGPLPDSLLKTIANEDVTTTRRQMTNANQSILQQRGHQKQPQQQQQSLAYFSSSSSAPQTQSHQDRQQQQQQRQVSVVRPQNMVAHPTTFSQYHQQRDQPQQCSQKILQQHRHQQFQQLPQQKHHANAAVLQRQLAFDFPQYPEKEMMANHHASSSSQVTPSRGQNYGPEPTACLPQQQKLPVQQQVNGGTPSLHHQRYSAPQLHGAASRQELFLPRGKSDPEVRHHHSYKKFNLVSNTGNDNSGVSISHGRVESIRGKSLEASAKQSDLGFGFFTGSLLEASKSSSLNLTASTAEEDTISTEEPINEQKLFQSSFISQKRTLSDPHIPTFPKRMKMAPGNTSFDPQATLRDLTRVTCFDVTKTSNTSSPAFIRTMPSNTPSPTPTLRFSGKSNSTPCSSITASPAPLSSLSSILELSVSSPRPSSALFDTSAGLPSTSIPGLHVSSTIAYPPTCSATGLSASIAEPIPEWYSFLADLEDGAMSTFTSRHGASSGQVTPMALTPKQHDQPLTPEPSFMNVPNIIDEILDCEDQLL